MKVPIVSSREPVIASIVRGIPGQWSACYVRGIIPQGWRLVHGPAAQDDLEGGVVLTVGAEDARGKHAGGKLRVPAERLAAGAGDRAKLIADLLAELADELRRDCEAKAT